MAKACTNRGEHNHTPSLITVALQHVYIFPTSTWWFVWKWHAHGQADWVIKSLHSRTCSQMFCRFGCARCDNWRCVNRAFKWVQACEAVRSDSTEWVWRSMRESWQPRARFFSVETWEIPLLCKAGLNYYVAEKETKWKEDSLESCHPVLR